jgi:hypothetical protein
MTKYLILMKFNETLWPKDAKESAALLKKMLELTKQDLKSGQLKDYGYFLGSGGQYAGYAVSGQSPEDIQKVAMQLSPYVTFEVHPAFSITEIETLWKSMMP